MTEATARVRAAAPPQILAVTEATARIWFLQDTLFTGLVFSKSNRLFTKFFVLFLLSCSVVFSWTGLVLLSIAGLA